MAAIVFQIPMTIKIACPHCQQRIEAPGDVIGTVVTCPTCQQPIHVGFRGESAAPSAKTYSRKPATKKLLLFAGLGCGGVFLLVIILAIAIWIVTPSPAQTIHPPMVASISIMTKLGEDFEAGTHPSTALKVAIEQLQQVDVSACPPDFREAYVRFLNAMRMLKSEADELPKSQFEQVIQGFLNGLGGEADGGYGRVTRSYTARVREVQVAHGELIAIATRHGVK